MIPSDIRLYTWVDVEEVLLRLQEEGNWPEWLVWARSYWDEFILGIRPGTKSEAKAWLNETYDPRYRMNSDGEFPDGYIILESLREHERTLPILLEETEESPPTPRLVPSLARPSVLWQPTDQTQHPESFSHDIPPVVAFHSFKGGVGRTTHALALAQALAEEKSKVLLVDGDLEAPGISWVFKRRMPSPSVSFADLLALAHGDPSPEAENAIQLVANRLQSSLIDQIYVLPSFRSTSEFTSLEIRPEHLIKGAKNPFLITQILANLGKVLQVDVVIVDLRAGLSELATGLILDPRVYRIFVTTLSGQSMSGTLELFKLIVQRAASTQDEDPLPAWIFTKVPQDQGFQNLVNENEAEILKVIQPLLEQNNELIPTRIKTSFADSLVVLPESWEDIVIKLKSSGLIESVHPLLEWLPSRKNISSEQSDQVVSTLDINQQREHLKDKTQKLVYAETAEIDDFFPTNPLRSLASDHRLRVPITVIIGAKGSGKTYTFLQIIRRVNWQNFAQAAGVQEVQASANTFPFLASQNLENKAQELVKNTRNLTIQSLEFEQPPNDIDSIISDSIRGDDYNHQLHEGEWRELWLDLIAWSMGFQVKNRGAGRNLAAYLAEKQQQVVIVIDGLEDLFQNITNAPAQQTALRSLLQEVPKWLEQQPSRSLGIIIFIRRDFVIAAIHQNSAQMLARYEPYALNWSWEEALRLIAWVILKAGIFSDINPEKLQEMSKDELVEYLTPLWGQKLGSDRSREARSDKFVITALSDFKGQVQSRDLVRLLCIAAEKSINNSYWQDRILVPPAIKDALPDCSKAKIQEIEQENAELKDIFRHLQSLDEKDRKSPFTLQEVKLSLEQINVLKNNGVILPDRDKYYMCEIFRYGLNFSQNAGRSKVLSLARLAGLG
ncbi:MAG: AAA family ATPase [Limnoraphis sp. WC205]|jgi:MinD-like ATPase involved in chromosome partitioning or flagellar assembly|nr:AAA family ATPase [Limnoraphis sp. WC205]